MKKFAAALLLAVALAPGALAFPPAPYHVIYGMVRDQWGTPLNAPNVSVVLETLSGTRFPVGVVAGLEPGVNYEIQVPMDAGLTSDLYQQNALLYATPSRLYVCVGTTTNIPIQTLTNVTALGKPGASTRIDLTLGNDSNGDGIPDAWEQAYLSALGLNIPLSSLNPNSDLAHDGRSLLQEFMLGNYPFDPSNTFQVTIVGMNNGEPVVQFPTMTGRSYTLLGSTDMRAWSPLAFRLPTDAPTAATHTFYYSSGIGTAQVQVARPDAAQQGLFIRLLLQ